MIGNPTKRHRRNLFVSPLWWVPCWSESSSYGSVSRRDATNDVGQTSDARGKRTAKRRATIHCDRMTVYESAYRSFFFDRRTKEQGSDPRALEVHAALVESKIRERTSAASVSPGVFRFGPSRPETVATRLYPDLLLLVEKDSRSPTKHRSSPSILTLTLTGPSNQPERHARDSQLPRPSAHLLVELVEIAVHRRRRLIPVPSHRPLGQDHAHAHAPLGRGPVLGVPGVGPAPLLAGNASPALGVPRGHGRARARTRAFRTEVALGALVVLDVVVGAPLRPRPGGILEILLVGFLGGVLGRCRPPTVGNKRGVRRGANRGGVASSPGAAPCLLVLEGRRRAAQEKQ